MAHLDLEEQEQMAQLKAFWNQYGNLLTWALALVLVLAGAKLLGLALLR